MLANNVDPDQTPHQTPHLHYLPMTVLRVSSKNGLKKKNEFSCLMYCFKARFHVEVSTRISIRNTQILHCALR